MKRYLRYLKNALYNLYTIIAQLFIKQDNKTIVIGSWMGRRFADNSRYLFQYLSSNKTQLELDHVVWITRDLELCDSLIRLGYEACMGGTYESRKWHLKAGIHIICNNYGYGDMLPDIDTRYSWTAKKIQLWHGVGMKAVGKASKALSSDAPMTNRFSIKCQQLKSFLYEGGWSDAYVLSTSELNAEINKKIFLVDDSRIIRSAYPRNCECLQLLDYEESIIQRINNYKARIIYLPTFRDKNTKYVHPLTSDQMISLIKDNGLLWIEKAHTADKDYQAPDVNDNLMVLNSTFDCNILYPYIDIVITDYSSVAFDGIYNNIPTIMYAPDYDEFKNGSVGFLFDVREKCGSIMTYDIPNTIGYIKECLRNSYMTQERRNTYQYVQREFFNNEKSIYFNIWNSILAEVNGRRDTL